jgi:hypothetical protein
VNLYTYNSDRQSSSINVIGEEQLNDANALNGHATCGLDKPINDPYQITNNNTTCTKGCTQEHEDKHAADFLPCCKKARAAFQANGANKSEIMRKWNDYILSSRNWAECRAYNISITCGEKLKKDKCPCAPLPKKPTEEQKKKHAEDTQCCKDIDDYIKVSKANKDIFCGAGGSYAACPF